jgi:hypothetical protein
LPLLTRVVVHEPNRLDQREAHSHVALHASSLIACSALPTTSARSKPIKGERVSARCDVRRTFLRRETNPLM